ncbi:MAG TPA: hypothetical protein VNO30_09175 [Kofleriaceae bacterium]|nr:hypothetical protein [Kofleriaceae bacterium]
MIVALLGCGKDDGKPGAPSAGSRDVVLEAWKKGGLTPSPFTAATVAFGKDCQSGTVNGVDVLVCQYATDEEARAAEDKALEWVGEATGIARAAGKVVVAAADRRKADPSGRTLNQLTKLLTPK